MSPATRTTAAAYLGLRSTLVNVEIDVPSSGGRPTAKSEMVHRIDAAIRNSGYSVPETGYTVNVVGKVPALGPPTWTSRRPSLSSRHPTRSPPTPPAAGC